MTPDPPELTPLPVDQPADAPSPSPPPEETASPVVTETDVSESTPGRSRLRAYMPLIIAACACGLVLKLFFVEAFGIPSSSMENTLLVGDFLLVNKTPYGIYTPRTVPLTSIPMPHVKIFPGYSSPDRGDVIVFEMPVTSKLTGTTESRCYVKRLIGLPGDTIEISGKLLLVNGTVQQPPEHAQFESFMQRKGEVEPDIFPKGLPYNKDWWGPVVVPFQGMQIELTPKSLDQWRQFIEQEGHAIRFATDGRIEIDGRPTETYEVGMNYYFFMGDNRDNSIDSRYWGYVPRRNLIGTPALIYWSWDSSIPITSPLKLLASIRWDRIFHTVP